jgi:hypothetical protein
MTATDVRFGTLSPDGTTHWSSSVPVAAGAASVTSQLPRGAGVGLVMQAFGPIPGQRAAISVGGHPYELAGSLSSAIMPGPWHQVGVVQGYSVFARTKAPTPIVAVTAGGQRLPVQVLSSSTKSEQVRVRAPVSATVVRSVAWDSGWTGSVSVDGAKATAVEVGSIDLVQQITIPPGDDVVTFHYSPPRLRVATILTLGALAFLVLLGLAFLALRLYGRRRRRGPIEVMEPPLHEEEFAQQYG